MEMELPQTGREDPKGTACIGCRLRRKKCDKKQPICTGCSDLQIPRDLCIYRKMGLSSKDSKATLSKEIKKNRELKDDKERTLAVFKYNKKSTGSPQDYFYLRDARKETPYKQFQLNPEKNPLLCTVMTAPQTSAYLGSISVAAITEAEPQMKMLLQQIHRVIMKEKLVYEKRVSGEATNSEKEIVVRAFNEQCKASLVGMKDAQGDQTILELINDIQEHYPSKEVCDYVLNLFFKQNKDRWVLFPYIDEASFMKKFTSTVIWDENGRATFNVALTYEPQKIVFIALSLAIFAIASFCLGQSKTDIDFPDYLLFAKYAHAVMRIDVIGKNIRLGEDAIGFDYIATMYTLLLLEKYTATAGFLDSLDQICEATLSIRLLITIAMSINLNKDLDRFYPNASVEEKRSMKSLWYTLVLYETFESMDVGFLSKFEPPSFRRYDYCYNHLIESIHIIHGVLFNYNMIDDMGKVEDLVDFMETTLIKRLKGILNSEFPLMSEDINAFQNHNLDDLSPENSEGYMMILQRLAMRYFILATILAFYHICLKRLQQIGDGDSEKCRKFRLLGWKYTLTIETLFKEMWIGFNRIGNHKNYFEFFPILSLLVMAPIVRFAQRRVTLFAVSRFLSMFNIDDQLIVNHVLYGNDSYNDAVLKSLQESGELERMYKISDFDDLEIDDDHEQLMLKFGNLASVRFLVISLSKVMSDTLQLMHTGQTRFNFLKLSKIFHVLVLRLCSFLLNYTVQDSDNSEPEDGHIRDLPVAVMGPPMEPPGIDTGSPPPPETRKFDFKSFFSTAQDVTMDEDEILELFNMTSRNRHTW